MNELRRQAYLEAMGIEVWQARPQPVARNRLLAPEADGSLLLICEHQGQREQRIVADICRCLGDSLAWAWSDPEGKDSSPDLETLIRQRLFTEVIVFGAELAGHLAGPDVPDVVASARVHVAPDLDELAASGLARQAFWNEVLKHRGH